MAGITDYFKVSAASLKIQKNDDLKKPSDTRAESKTEKTVSGNSRTDQAEISQKARGLLNLRMDAKKYLDTIDQSETLSENEVNQLKQHIESKYFVNDAVIDQIVDKIVDLPNFSE